MLRTQLTNFLFIGLVGYGESIVGAVGKRLGIRDFIVLLVVIELTYVLAPLTGILAHWPQTTYTRLYLCGHKWFLLVCLWGKVYVVLLGWIRVPAWLQCSTLLLALCFCQGSMLTICVEGGFGEVSLLSFIANIFAIQPQGCAALLPPWVLRRCSSLLSFSTFDGVELMDDSAEVNAHLVLQYVVAYHYGPSFVRAMGYWAKRVLIWLRARAESCTPKEHTGLLLRVGKPLVGLFAFFAGMVLSAIWYDTGVCTRTNAMIEPLHQNAANTLAFRETLNAGLLINEWGAAELLLSVQRNDSTTRNLTTVDWERLDCRG